MSPVYTIGDKEIKYIGQSIDIVKRIREHRRCGRIKFDRFSMIPVCKTKLTEVETWYIRHFRPQYNKVKSKPTIAELRIAMKRKKMESNIPLKNLDEILSEDNRALLDVIKAGQPTTIKSLAKMTGRKPAHLSRRLKYLENYGIIEIERSANHTAPIIKITDY